MNRVTKQYLVWIFALLCVMALTLSVAAYGRTAVAEGDKFTATYGTYISSYSKTSTYDDAAEFRINGSTSGRVGYLQFDLTEYLTVHSSIQKAELVLNLTNTAPASGAKVSVAYSQSDGWKGGDNKDNFNWNDGTRGPINNGVVSSLTKEYALPVSLGEFRMDITDMINWVIENHGTQVNDEQVDYVISIRLLSQSGFYFSSQNAEEELRPYIQFDYVPSAPGVKVTLSGDGNGRLIPDALEVTDGAITVEEGGSVRINVLPNPGYEIKEVKVGGEDKTASVENYALLLEDIRTQTEVNVTFIKQEDGKIYPTDDFTRARHSDTPISAADLRVKTAGGIGDTTRVSYLKFDLTDYDGKKDAYFNFYASGGGDWKGNFNFTVYGYNYTAWAEGNSYTWASYPLDGLLSIDENNKAAMAHATVVATASIAQRAAWYSVEITNYLREQKLIGSSAVTFALVGTDVTGSFALLRSKDSAEVVEGKLTYPYIECRDTIYSITCDEAQNGSLQFEGSAARHQNVTVTVVPEAGYALSKLTVNGEDVTALVSGNAYCLVNVTSDIKLEAQFTRAATVTLNVGEHVKAYDGQGNALSGELKLAEGSTLEIFLLPDAGYKAVVSGDCTAEYNKISLTVSGDATITVSAAALLS